MWNFNYRNAQIIEGRIGFGGSVIGFQGLDFNRIWIPFVLTIMMPKIYSTVVRVLENNRIGVFLDEREVVKWERGK